MELSVSYHGTAAFSSPVFSALTGRMRADIITASEKQERNAMATTKDYLDFVCTQLEGIRGVDYGTL